MYSIKSKQQKGSYNIYNKKLQHSIMQHDFKKNKLDKMKRRCADDYVSTKIQKKT